MNIETAVEKRKKRWREFYNGSGPDFMFIVRGCGTGPACEDVKRLWPGHEKDFIESAWGNYLGHCKTAEWLDDDYVPHLSCITGTEIFAEAFGCEVHRPDHTNPFALPKVQNASAAEGITVPDISRSSLARYIEMAQKLHDRADGKALLRLVDIQSPMDISALIWEKSDFMMAMIETPASVRNLAVKVRRLLCDFFDEWFGRFGTEYVAHFPEYFMSGGITLSEDECGCVNPDLFEELFLEHLNFLSERYGGIGMHCCADSRHQWGNFAKIRGLRLLNLCCPPTRSGMEFVRDAFKFFEGRTAQWHCGWQPSGPYENWPSQYPEKAKVVIEINAQSKEEARDICMSMKRIRGE